MYPKRMPATELEKDPKKKSRERKKSESAICSAGEHARSRGNRLDSEAGARGSRNSDLQKSSYQSID